MTLRIDGKALAAQLEQKSLARAQALQAQCGRAPHLTVILVGEDPASCVYVRNKERACERAGVTSETLRLPAQTTQAELLSRIDELNRNDQVDGILIQLPLPKHIDADTVIDAISPTKDVDGFHLLSAGALLTGQAHGFRPCTPAGVMEMLADAQIDLRGKDAVIVGRSNIVGKPLALMLLEKNATVTIAHSHSKDLKDICRRADVLVAAVGRAKMITADMVKPGAVVIDVGINRDTDGSLCGDVDYENVYNVASAITPVPGGVGPMTIAMLVHNTITALERRLQSA